MKLLHSVPVANSNLNFYLPKGQWGNILIEYDVVTDTGLTMTRADAGNVKLNWGGDDVINVDAEILNLLNNVYGGVAEASFASAAANRMVVILPSGLWFDSGNIFDVANKDEVYIDLSFAALAAKCVSGNVRIYSKPKIGVMNYLHKIVSRFVVAGGASVLADTFPISNISQVYLKNPAGSNVTQVQLTKNEETVVNASVQALIAYSDNIHNLETTNTTLALEMGESKDIRENIGNQIDYNYTFSAAGTLYQYFSHLHFTNEKALTSRQTSQNKLIAAMNGKLRG